MRKNSLKRLVDSLSAQLLLLTLAALSLSARAADTLDEGVGKAMLMKPDTDNELAHYWFETAFGSFIWAPWGTGGSSVTLLTDALGYVNILAWLLGGVIAWYQIFGGAINTAQEGEVLGRAWNSAWLPIRNAIAFFLITPAATVGGGVLSFSQVFVVWLIIIGSNGGTLLWQHIGTQITSGTTIYPVEMSVPLNYTTSILKMITCTNALFESTESEISARGDKSSGSPGIVSGVSISEGDSKILFGNNGGRCGSISLPSMGIVDDITSVLDKSSNAAVLREANAAERKAIAAHVGRLAAIDAQLRAASFEDATGGNFLANADEGTPAYSKSLLELSKLAVAIRGAHDQFNKEINENIRKTIYNTSSNEQFLKQITQGGWANAGTWYFQLSKREGIAQKVMNGISGGVSGFALPDTCASDWKYGNCAPPLKLLDNVKAVEKAIGLIASEAPSTGIDAGMELPSISSDSNTDVMGYMNSWGAGVARTIMRALNGSSDLLGSTNGMYGESSVTGNEKGFINPFLTTANIGHAYINIGIAAWGLGLAAETTSVMTDKGGGFLGGLVDATPVAGGWKAVASKMLTLLATALLAVGMLLLGLGFALAYLVPLMPVLTWVMMLASYMVSVIEAVVGAPLAVIMMATPEGDGIVGAKQQTAIQLVAVIILKPALMVIGILASITLGGIIFGFFNQMFWKAADLTSSGVIDVLAILSIYTGFALQVCKFSVGIMPKIPDQILKWFTTGVGESFGDTTAAATAEQNTESARESLSSGTRAVSERLSAIKGKMPQGEQRVAA